MNQQQDPDMHIVIVGGGAGGLELAAKLGRRYRRDDAVRITLVDRVQSHLWKPLLHEVAAGSLNSFDDEISYLAQAYLNHFSFRLGALKALDRANRTITLAASLDPHGEPYIPERTLSYDLLVIAVGSVTNDFDIPGVAEHCFFLDSREQADAFHQHLLRSCYAADARNGPSSAAQLHIAIAGAGATGVELAAELHHSMRELVGFGLDNIDIEQDLRIHLIEASARVLPGLPQRVSDSTSVLLADMGIVVHTGASIARADADGFETADGQTIAAGIRVWAAGIKGPALLDNLDGLQCNRARQLLVRPTLQCVDDDQIFALGDCAACPLPDSERNVPPRAQAAHQQAMHVVDAVARLRAGKPLKPYRYKDFGSLINLSRHSAIGTLMGNLLGRHQTNVPLEGRLARWAYLSLYKMHQVAVNGVLRTTLTSIADVLTRASKPRLKLH